MGRKPCCDKSLNKRGSWTQEEDDLLVQYIRTHGHGSWRSLPKAAGLRRCGKSCRLRWINYLRPDLKRGNFTDQEDEIIIDLHQMLGNKWSVIARRLPGRTDNEIKNHWNSCIRRKLIDSGIDPNTHRAIKEFADHSRKRRQRRPRKQLAPPKRMQQPNNQPRVEEDERTNLEPQPHPPMQQQPEVETPREEKDHINLELNLALSPTPPQPTARPELQRTTAAAAAAAAAGPSGGAGTVCVGCSQLIRREGSDNSRNCDCQLLKLSL